MKDKVYTEYALMQAINGDHRMKAKALTREKPRKLCSSPFDPKGHPLCKLKYFLAQCGTLQGLVAAIEVKRTIKRGP